MIQTEGIFVGGSAISAPIIGKDFNWTGGDGTYQVLDDGGGNWRIKFLSSGTFTPLKNMVVDGFLVGGGGASASSYCGYGGAGYTTTVRSVVLAANTAYPIVVGAAGTQTYSSQSNGGTSSAFSAVAKGGYRSVSGDKTWRKPGADGGSGGGGLYADGGIDGGDGAKDSDSLATSGGKGQGTTTREFGEADGDLYASGGGRNLKATVPNSGNGGYYGGSTSVKPADGIVIIRQHKEVAA